MNKTILVLLAVLFAGTIQHTYGSGTSGPAMQNSNNTNEHTVSKQELSLYDQGLAATHDNDFQKALELFKLAADHDPSNADVWNMLAHSQRKLGLIDEAIANYWKALEIRPHFPEAREYLGEAYIQGALQQMEILKGYGDSGKEQLEDLTDAFKASVKKLEDGKKDH